MAWRGNLSRNLKELWILLCQSSPASSSTRSFVEKNYKDLNKLNPRFPILMLRYRASAMGKIRKVEMEVFWERAAMEAGSVGLRRDVIEKEF